MTFSEPLSQYEEILRDAIQASVKESGAKLAKTFQNLLVEILTLYMILPRKINFTQMARYGRHCEQTYRQNFNRRKKDCADWLLLNLSLARRVLDMDGLLAIAIDPCYISKAGKKTPHVGRFWSGCAGAVRHGLEIMGIGLLDVRNNKCMMLRAHQTLGNSALKMRNKTLVDYYIDVIKRYSKKLLAVTDVVVADAFFSTSTFEKGISEFGFFLVSRFRDNACLHYIPKREKRRGRPRVKGDRIDLNNLNLSCMEELFIDGLDGKAYTLEAYARALKKRVRLVIWRMPGGKCKLFFSTKLSMTGEEVLMTYRTRFQIEFCYRDSKQFTGLMDCQARHKRQLDFAFNASFASLNAARVFMKDNGMDNSMAKVKSLMFNANFTKLIFDMSRYRPNRTLISQIVKELIGWQPKVA
jgi:hypothetical protein